MRKLIYSSIALLCLVSCGNRKEVKMIEPVKFSEITIDDSFWNPRLEAHKNVTLGLCIDQIENRSGRIRNFENAAGGKGGHSGIFFDDSDVYKALEGMAYSLQNSPDSLLEAKCDEWIDKFAAAQRPDGYLNTYYTLTGLENRWTDMDLHEMYCAGHMIEAAVAYYDVTGKRKLLDVCEKFVEHMMTVFGPGKRDWVPGHEEIELALVKLYETTGKKEYLDFSRWLLEERGHGHGRIIKDGETVEWPLAYHQDSAPVSEITDIEGHAVRAMYLYCGMADVAAHTHDAQYVAVLEHLWDLVTGSKMYITGGIGSVRTSEGFGEPYSLPNLEAYCETCASVGMVLWNWRMNQFSGDGKYVDILEKAMYNGVLSGISLAGDKFFYVNPLESKGDHHRMPWFGCACCPSNICRFLPSIGNYIYGVSEDALWVNSFIGNESDYMSMKTRYPWDGTVSMVVGSLGASKKELRVRIPGWCRSWEMRLRGKTIEPRIEKGYAVIDGKFKAGDEIVFSMDMPVEIVAADPRVADDIGKRAVQRGPVIYCLEEVDNPSIGTSVIDNKPLKAAFDPELLGGVVRIDSDNLHFVPYYSWDNRAAGRMKVWVDADRTFQDVRETPADNRKLSVSDEKGGALDKREEIEWSMFWTAHADGTTLPRVLLIGDSITNQYHHSVDGLLEGLAAVSRLATSKSLGSPHLLEEIRMIMEEYRFDVVHFNNGLHGWQYSEEEYAEALPQMYELIRTLAPDAKLIWATCTAIHQGEGMKEFDDRLPRIIERNRIAKEFFKDKPVIIDDLYELSLDASYYENGDGCHFNPRGVEAAAAQVASVIKPLL